MKESNRSFFTFLAIFIAAYGGIHLYLWERLIVPLELTGFCYWLALVVFWFLCVSFPVVHFGFRRHNGPLITAVNFVSSVWVGMIVYFLLCLLVVDVVSVIGWGGVFFGRTTTMAIVSLVSLVTLYGLLEANSIVVTPLPVRMPNLPPSLEGLRVAQISDVHMGLIVRGSRLERIVSLVNAQKPDLILITGDLVDEQALHMEDMIHPLRRLTCQYGVYAVTGNHEYYAGIERAQAFIEKAGVIMLRNRWVTIGDGLQLIGRDDPAATGVTGEPVPSLETIMQGIDPMKPSILMYHTPRTTLAELQSRVIGLQLSGHTHKGQLWPFNYIVKMIFKTYYGRFTLGDSTVYVSRGTGTWGPPMRVLARPEVTLITLSAREHHEPA